MSPVDRFETDYSSERIRQDPQSFNPLRVPRICVAAAKGGVFKTTTTMNLAYSIANSPHHKCRVLVFDLDAQGNLSKYFTRQLYLDNLNKLSQIQDKTQRRVFRSRFLCKNDVPESTSVKQLLKGQASEVLELYGVGCVGWTKDWTDEFTEDTECITLFQKGIIETITHYKPDIVFFDTTPIDSLSGRFALSNSTHFFSTFSPDQDSLDGVHETFKIVDSFANEERTNLVKCCAVIPSGVQERTNLSKVLIQAAKDDYAELVTTSIPYSVKYREASFLGKPMAEFARLRIEDAQKKKKHIREREIKEWQEIITRLDEIANDFMNRLAYDNLCTGLTEDAIANIKEYFSYSETTT